MDLIMKDKEMIEKLANLIYDSKPIKEIWIEDAEAIAKTLYSAGYRKIPKDSVVLSREEYERDLTAQYDVGYEFGSKETAEKFESELKAFIKVWKMAEDDAMSIPFYRALFEKIGELAKQFGVDIKE